MARTTPYSPQFKHDAVQLVTQYNRSVRSVALELGIGQSTLWKWVKKMNSENTPTPDNDNPPTPEEMLAAQEEIKRLKAANKTLKMELEFSKKVATWMAKPANKVPSHPTLP